jgi:hypothetical protein
VNTGNKEKRRNEAKDPSDVLLRSHYLLSNPQCSTGILNGKLKVPPADQRPSFKAHQMEKLGHS